MSIQCTPEGFVNVVTLVAALQGELQTLRAKCRSLGLRLLTICTTRLYERQLGDAFLTLDTHRFEDAGRWATAMKRRII